jgi:hypothetical protein
MSTLLRFTELISVQGVGTLTQPDSVHAMDPGRIRDGSSSEKEVHTCSTISGPYVAAYGENDKTHLGGSIEAKRVKQTVHFPGFRIITHSIIPGVSWGVIGGRKGWCLPPIVKRRGSRAVCQRREMNDIRQRDDARRA